MAQFSEIPHSGVLLGRGMYFQQDPTTLNKEGLEEDRQEDLSPLHKKPQRHQNASLASCSTAATLTAQTLGSEPETSSMQEAFPSLLGDSQSSKEISDACTPLKHPTTQKAFPTLLGDRQSSKEASDAGTPLKNLKDPTMQKAFPTLLGDRQSSKEASDAGTPLKNLKDPTMQKACPTLLGDRQSSKEASDARTPPKDPVHLSPRGVDKASRSDAEKAEKPKSSCIKPSYNIPPDHPVWQSFNYHREWKKNYDAVVYGPFRV
eukprot:TRINITY_DN4718_c0_g1_i1.p1 TRINITY_DN4718_c0_g1~~TRINITY_DN4718_c0_g1_i1.p1  ORF type:complete len:262 (+),score=63.78 TRINITY_DN4718_c0_g1_i1:88-873(+)